MKHYVILGAGLGSPEFLTGRAAETIRRADHVLTTERIAHGLSGLRADIEVLPFSQLGARAEQCEGTTAVLVSGDTGFFSAASALYERLSQTAPTELVCGIGSMQAFCAAIGERYDDVFWLSVHGRSAHSLLGAVSYHKKVFALTGGTFCAQEVCRLMCKNGLGQLRVVIGEQLGAPDERILRGTAAELVQMPTDSLAVMMIYNDNPADAYRPLRDEDFVRAKVPMTKQEVRWLVRDLLAVRPEDVVYDIGAGTGSCTMELARCANLGAVYAVECKPEAVQLIRENREKTKNFHVSVIEATAPDGLSELPPPDCVFIGGSRGNLAEIVAACVEKNPKVRMVITAIALETLAQAQQAMADFCEVSITCVNISRAKTVGNYHMMTANNPVWVIGGRHE